MPCEWVRRARLDKRKIWEALFTHCSQIGESWLSKILAEIAQEAFGVENFIGASGHSTGAPVPKDDLFADLRS